MKLGRSIFKTFFVSLCIIANTSFAYAQTASILPPAKTTFTDQNGKPLTSGTVDFYIPGTTTRKTTWQDSAETVPNTNPVVLDAAGRGIILGDGAYRQVVKDRNGNLIWDQVTSSLGSGGSGGTTIGDGLAVGTILPSSAVIAPANYQFAYGQALSRSTYSYLFTAITISTSVGCTGGSPVINVTDTSSVAVGAVLESICVSGSPTVISKTSNTVTLSANATVTISTTGVFFLYGNGDGLTTFNLPDLRGYVAAGRCNMGGVDCSVLNSTYFSSNSNNTPSGVNAKGGSQSKTILQANFPNVSLPVTDPGHSHVTSPNPSTVLGAGSGSGFGAGSFSSFGMVINAALTGISVHTGGSGTPISSVQPTLTLNYVIKVTPDSNLTSTFGVASIGGMTGIIACGSGITCAGNTISFTGSVVNSIQGMSGNITCGTGLNCSGNVINSSTAALVQSRTIAQSMNLGSYSAITTQGYYAGGDGGGATFQNVNSGIATINLSSGGSGCTNGTWPTPLMGGTGTGARATLVVSGGVVIAATLNSRGVNYAAGNTLDQGGTFPCGVNPVITVATTGNAPFKDTWITAGTISNAGAGYTNGTYYNVQLDGGSGTKAYAVVVVAGGVVTSVQLSGVGGIIVSGGNAYSVGDVLTVGTGGTTIPGGSGFTYTVTNVSTPLGSFTDSAGNHFQIVSSTGAINTRQFGAKLDYNRDSGEANATNDQPSTQAALNFTSGGMFFIDNGGFLGGKVTVGKGTSKICGGLIVPHGVIFSGESQSSSTLQQCNSDAAGAHFIELGDRTTHESSFFESVQNMSLVGNFTGVGNVAMIYSEGQQQGIAVKNVTIYPVTRACVYTQTGWGGDANFHIFNLFCVMGNLSPFGVWLNYPAATQVIDGDSQFAFNTVNPGIKITTNSGAINVIREFYCEQITNCININDAGGASYTYIENSHGGPGVTDFIKIEAASVANRLKVSTVRCDGPGNTVNNKGVLVPGVIFADTIY